MTKAYITYRKQKIEVTIDSTFQGANGMMANVTAVDGYPFYSQDVEAQGDTFGSWMCNGYRVRADFVTTEAEDSGLAFLELSDTTSIAMTPKLDRLTAELEQDKHKALKIVLDVTAPAWQIEAKAQAADANDYQNTISGALEKPVFGSAKWFDEIEEVKY